MNYDGKYVKTKDQKAFWAVDDGQRRLIVSTAEVFADPRPVELVTAEELAAIPLEGTIEPEPEPEIEVEFEDLEF
jgi:hypothetical protein